MVLKLCYLELRQVVLGDFFLDFLKLGISIQNRFQRFKIMLMPASTVPRTVPAAVFAVTLAASAADSRGQGATQAPASSSDACLTNVLRVGDAGMSVLLSAWRHGAVGERYVQRDAVARADRT